MLKRSQLTNLALYNARTEGHSEFDMMCIATCYLAGPMRGYQDYNFPAFEEAERSLRDAGWHVFSPRENDAESGLTGTSELMPLKWYMRKDLAQVASSDAVFFLPGWEESKGAMLEHQVAQYLEIPCYRYEDGGRISIIGSDQDGILLGVDHDQVEGRELFDTLIEEGPAITPGYTSAQEQLERAYSASIMEKRQRDVFDRSEFVSGEGQCDDEDCACNEPLGLYAENQAPPIDVDKLVDFVRSTYADDYPGRLDSPWRKAPGGGAPTELSHHPNSARFHELLKEMGALHDRKQADYGSGEDPFSNVRASQDFGIDAWVGAIVRLNDKVKRLQSMVRKGHLINESAYDSFKDIAVYAIIALCLYEEQYGREA